MAILPPLVYNADEAADVCRVSRRTIFNWTRDREFPHVRVGSRILFPVDRVRAWLDAQASGTTMEDRGDCSSSPRTAARKAEAAR